MEAVLCGSTAVSTLVPSQPLGKALMPSRVIIQLEVPAQFFWVIQSLVELDESFNGYRVSTGWYGP